MTKLPDIQVVIPYKTLVDLLQASESVNELQKLLVFQDQQITAIRTQISEMMQVICDLRRELNSLS